MTPMSEAKQWATIPLQHQHIRLSMNALIASGGGQRQQDNVTRL